MSITTKNISPLVTGPAFSTKFEESHFYKTNNRIEKIINADSCNLSKSLFKFSLLYLVVVIMYAIRMK